MAFRPIQKQFTTQRAVFLHAGWLDQASAHCPIFLTAASRRSRVRVSVPVWGTTLSRPLPIVALVGRYPPNKLIGRTLIDCRRNFDPQDMRPKGAIRDYSPFPVTFPRQSADCVRVTHPCATRQQEQAPLLPFDLHVLSLPPAFILSQDQTLRSKILTVRQTC